MDIHERIAFARDVADLTQDQVAAHFGINRVSVAQWEGKRSKPSVGKLIELASLFHTTPEWLIDGVGDAPAKQEAGSSVDDAKAKIMELIRQIPDLAPQNYAPILSIIQTLREANIARRKQPAPHGQSSLSNPRRVEAPSE